MRSDVVHHLYEVLFRIFRPGRIRRLYQAMGITPETTVIDIGGSMSLWRMVETAGFPLPRLTIVNLTPAPRNLPPGVTWVQADARALPYADRSFDVAVSNSLIEHLRDYQGQQRFAAEAQRIARRYFIQTPDFYFPFEPHFLAPFVHWVPRTFRPAALWLTPRAWIERSTAHRLRELVEEIRLLDRSEMKRLFPGAEIVSERFLGLSRSLIAQQA